MWSEELAFKNLEIAFENKLWYRVIAIDLETKIDSRDDFLTNELILGISLARRMPSGLIEKIGLILEEETRESELALLKKLDKILQEWKPLITVGYGCKDYDLPLLAIKKRKCKQVGESVWGIVNLLNGSIHIELANLSRYVLYKFFNESRKYRKMIDIMKHNAFSDLPFVNTKFEFDLTFEEKGKQIYETWKTKNPRYYDYLIAEAHDQLLIAERIRDLLIKKNFL